MSSLAALLRQMTLACVGFGLGNGTAIAATQGRLLDYRVQRLAPGIIDLDQPRPSPHAVVGDMLIDDPEPGVWNFGSPRVVELRVDRWRSGNGRGAIGLSATVPIPLRR